MGATNYRLCPACVKRDQEKLEALTRQLEATYGKIPLGEWNEIQAKIKHHPSLGETLREDYELGTQVIGTFFVNYRAFCESPECDYDVSYDHAEVLRQI